jgi:3-oxoadipate enol-lactonase
MAIAKINDIECYYEVHGSGRPLLLIEGLSSDSQTWQLVLDRLKEHFKVIIFDNRGVGRTKDSGKPFDIAIMAKDAVMLLEHLGIEDADVLGHSMGGYIAQEIAITYPAKVKKLILQSTATHTSERNKLLFLDLVEIYENDASYEALLKEFMVWILTPEYFNDKQKTKQFIEYAMNYSYRQTPEDFKRQVEAYLGYSSLNRADNIQAETLVISGKKDILITPEESNLLASKIQNATIKYIANAAHSIQVEAPEELADEICAFSRCRDQVRG